ncbi:MAG: arginine deiminase-related protein [Caulobacteraceae bacterium]
MTTPPTFLMTDPTHYDVAYEINPWMRPEAWSADPTANHRAATAGSQALREALEACGARVHMVPAAAGLPDLVFPANAAVVLDGKALTARFRHPERRGEEPLFLAALTALRDRGVLKDVVPIEGCFQEGAGDCIWDANRGLFWVGSGPRSSPDSGAIIAAHFGARVVELPLATEQYYHLDTCFCPLSGGEILYHPAALTAEARRRLTDLVPAGLLIEATDRDARAFCVNAVSLGRTVIMAAPPSDLRGRLEDRGYDVVGIDLAPFILSGGGAFCMTLRLDLVTAAAPARAVAASLALAS